MFASGDTLADPIAHIEGKGVRCIAEGIGAAEGCGNRAGLVKGASMVFKNFLHKHIPMIMFR